MEYGSIECRIYNVLKCNVGISSRDDRGQQPKIVTVEENTLMSEIRQWLEIPLSEKED